MVPVKTSERHVILDALRGFALLGICLANFPEFSLYTFQKPRITEAMPTAEIDQVVRFLQYLFVDGKFYTIFSLLFGIGFSIIISNAAKKGTDGFRIFYRRMIVLATIGFLHLMFIWSGDILLLYALLGMLLPLFRHVSDRVLLGTSAVLLLLPIPIDWLAGTPALPGASSTGSLSMYLMNLGGDDMERMQEVANEFLAKANQRPEIGMAYTTFNTNTPVYQFNVDREKAESLNVPVASVFTALQTFLGGSEINDFNAFGRTWKVVMQADAKYRTNVDDMRYFFVRSNNGDMVPLNTLVTDEGKTSSATVTRFNGVRAIKIAGNPATGYSTGQAMTALEETAAEILPTTYTYEWVDQSRDELEAGNRSTQIFIISLIFVFLCLAALYESWTIPLAVMLSVPVAALGCFGAQYLRGLQNDVYMQIGLIMLIGLNAKNAILIVEYAKMNMENGEPVVKAALDAARLRLRPILMTSFAFILGCVPLAIATGPGAGARVSMGNAVVGGMTFATMIGIFMIPVLFVVVERIFNRKKHSEE